MDTRVALFMIEGGRALELVREHIAERQRVRQENAAMIRELRLPADTEIRISRMDGKLMAIRFPHGTRPDGWTKPDRRHDCSRPKVGTEWAQRLKDQKGYESPEDVISKAFGVPLSLHYRDAKREGWTCIGPMLTACGWLYMSASGPYALWIPDVAEAVAAHEAKGFTVDEPAKSFRMDLPGCRRILQEEWDLMVAQRKLQVAQQKVVA